MTRPWERAGDASLLARRPHGAEKIVRTGNREIEEIVELLG